VTEDEFRARLLRHRRQHQIRYPVLIRQIADAGIEGVELRFLQCFFNDNISPSKRHYHASLLTGISHSARS
jgi:hypothetical protein